MGLEAGSIGLRSVRRFDLGYLRASAVKGNDIEPGAGGWE
jgi:hypothetical protein